MEENIWLKELDYRLSAPQLQRVLEEIARNMLKSGFPVEQIAALSGLDVEQIKALSGV